MSHTGIIIGKLEEIGQDAPVLGERVNQAHDVLHGLEARQNNGEVLSSEELAKMENIKNALSACEICLTSMCSELQTQFDNISASI